MKFTVITFYPPYKKLCPQNLHLLDVEKVRMVLSHERSQVVSSTVSLFHNTLTIGITLFLDSFISWSTMPTGCTSKDKSSLSSIGGASKTWDGSQTYFLNIDTWKTLWIRLISDGSSNRYATCPILSIILNEPIYLGFNFPLFWNWITPFQGATLRNTKSSTSNSNSFRRLSA